MSPTSSKVCVRWSAALRYSPKRRPRARSSRLEASRVCKSSDRRRLARERWGQVAPALALALVDEPRAQVSSRPPAAAAAASSRRCSRRRRRTQHRHQDLQQQQQLQPQPCLGCHRTRSAANGAARRGGGAWFRSSCGRPLGSARPARRIGKAALSPRCRCGLWLRCCASRASGTGMRACSTSCSSSSTARPNRCLTGPSSARCTAAKGSAKDAAPTLRSACFGRHTLG